MSFCQHEHKIIGGQSKENLKTSQLQKVFDTLSGVKFSVFEVKI